MLRGRSIPDDCVGPNLTGRPMPDQVAEKTVQVEKQM